MMNLIPFTRDHFAELASWFTSERDVVLWIGPMLGFPLDDTQLDGLLTESLSDPPLRCCWMAKHESDIMGHVHLRFDWRNGNATISGVVIAPQHRGRGLAAPMLTAVTKEAFGHAGIERLDLNVFTANTRAIGVYDRLGFTREGVMRSCVRVADERWDRLTMSILRSEWRP